MRFSAHTGSAYQAGDAFALWVAFFPIDELEIEWCGGIYRSMCWRFIHQLLSHGPSLPGQQ
jgi:hypothetical protein